MPNPSIHTPPATIPTRLLRLPLQSVLVVPFVLQLFAAVGLVGTLSFQNGQASVNEVAGNLRREIVARIQERLSAYLATPVSVDRFNANAAKAGTLNLEDIPRTASHFWQQIQVFDLTSAIYVGKASGQFVGAFRDSRGALSVRIAEPRTGSIYRTFAPSDRGYPSKLLQTVTTRRYDPRQRPWYRATVAAK